MANQTQECLIYKANILLLVYNNKKFMIKYLKKLHYVFICKKAPEADKVCLENWKSLKQNFEATQLKRD